MQPGLFNIFASAILRACKAPAGIYSSDQLNEIVGLFPAPLETLKQMNYTIGDAPIMFRDISFEHLGRFLIKLVEMGEPVWPVFLMPEDMLEIWHTDRDFKTLHAHLAGNDLGVTLTISGDKFEVRGDDVFPSDIRPRFLKGLEWLG